MPQLETLLAVFLAGLLFSASPGPSMAFVLSRSVQFGAPAGLASSLGLLVGGLCHALAAALGLGLLATRWPWVLDIVRVLGALYLAYLAYDAFAAARRPEPKADTEAEPEAQSTPKEPARLSQLFRHGVIVELFNPKTIIFFLSFIPPFVKGHSTAGVFLLSAMIPVSAVPADLIAIVAGGQVAKWAHAHGWLTRLTHALVGLVLLTIAILVLTTS
jgi:threonine/homoserine/homoserine lactone efflux protein